MTGSKPKCPVDPQTRHWIESRMAWLKSQFGADGLRTRPVVLPAAEFFPDAYVGISAANRTAEDGWKKAFGVSLPWQSYAAYNGMLAIFAGINKAGNADVGKVQPMLQGLTFDSVKGPITIKNRYFQQSASTYECAGDPAASAGWSCSNGVVLPMAEVTPAQYQ